jgi:hypothetical protein
MEHGRKTDPFYRGGDPYAAKLTESGKDIQKIYEMIAALSAWDAGTALQMRIRQLA